MATESVNRSGRAEEIRSWYDAHQYKCSVFQQRFVDHLELALQRAGLVDYRLESRTKSVDSYVKKAMAELPAGGFKYTDPKVEITDAVGVRVLVPLSTDVAPVARVLKEAYEVKEESARGDEETHVDTPGYRSLHLLVTVNEADAADVTFRGFGDMVVEVQVRTTLQHAWASLQHDVMYKAERPPSPAIRRRLIALAGLLELADREFVSVRQAHGETPDEVAADSVGSGARLTASALRHIAENILNEEDPAPQDWFQELARIVALLGIETIEQLESTLDEWSGRAPEVAAAVRVIKPWVNSAYVLDLLLRLALREEYFDRRPPDEGVDESLSPDDFQVARAAFLAELDGIQQAVAPE